MTKIITRFAPSPTGNLHLGGARTALINYIVAKQNASSKFYLRIEDTDKLRSKESYKINILESLKWLGFNWDKKPQIQSLNIDNHKKIANILLKNKLAYKCNCDEEKLDNNRNLIKKNNLLTKKICTTCKDDNNIQKLTSNFVVRIKIPEEGKTTISDKVQGNVTINNMELDDYIILRKDGTPTYMLSVVVDDHDLGVNLIIRGDDHLNNTFRQKYIYKFLNWKEPEYAHIPLVHGEDGAKLSKRHGAINLIELKEKGYLAEAIINNLILLGWSPNKKENEIIYLDEIINKFKIEDLSKSSSIFSYEKLNFFNNHYLKLEKYINHFENYCINNNLLNNYLKINKDKLIRIFNIYKKEISFYEQIIKYANTYYDKNFKTLKLSGKFEKSFNANLNEFIIKLEQLDKWDKKELESLIKVFLKTKNIKFPDFAKPIRFILIKSYQGASISDIFFILGKKDSIERLNQYINSI